MRTLHADGLTADDEVLARGFLESVARGYHQGRTDDETVEAWLRWIREEAAVLRGGWLPDGAFGAGPMPVATYLSFDRTLNAGSARLPVRMITEVSVSPAHRRQGWLRRMITADLDDAVAQGVPVAALTATEATIYGRFGFAPATRVQHIEVDTGTRFALRDFTDTGRVELVEPRTAWPAVQEVFGRFHSVTPGSVDRPAIFGPVLRGELNFTVNQHRDRLRTAVHLDATDTPDGYAVYRLETTATGQEYVVVVTELVAPEASAHLALWQFLAGIDLVTSVRMRRARFDDPLRWALQDLSCYRTTGIADHIWLRVLDVPLVLGSRLWAADGAVVLGVEDSLGHAAGTWALHVTDGRATVVPTDSAATVSLTAETLATLSLGGVRVGELASAGRLSGVPDAIARLAAMSDGVPTPHSVVTF
ncbi:GNAT family N-acetyltransferase [Streptomyces sp. NPDC048282]|uniref:GNAT family N-acetyltransferase n=1 Tax=Streptomyces sp. NPDC048282 TaxID=3365528 RepID=UPI00371A82AB